MKYGNERLKRDVAKTMILEFYHTHNTWPTASKCKPESERQLGWHLAKMHTSGEEPEFIEHIRGLGWTSRGDKVGSRKAAIVDFQAKHGRFPRRDTTNELAPGERQLGAYMLGYCCTTHSSFDADFLLKVIDLGYRPLAYSRTWDIPEVAERLYSK